MKLSLSDADLAMLEGKSMHAAGLKFLQTDIE